MDERRRGLERRAAIDADDPSASIRRFRDLVRSGEGRFVIIKNWMKRIFPSLERSGPSLLEPFIEYTIHVQSVPPMSVPLRVTLLVVVANPDDKIHVYDPRGESERAHGVSRWEQAHLARDGFKNWKKRFTFEPAPGQPERVKIEGTRIYGLKTSEDFVVRWYLERDGLSIWNQGQITTDIELDLERMGG